MWEVCKWTISLDNRADFQIENTETWLHEGNNRKSYFILKNLAATVYLGFVTDATIW